jgi:hypothetical protein
MKKCRCQNQSGTGIKGNSPVRNPLAPDAEMPMPSCATSIMARITGSIRLKSTISNQYRTLVFELESAALSKNDGLH